MPVTKPSPAPDPYAEFQNPAASSNPYAEFQNPANQIGDYKPDYTRQAQDLTPPDAKDGFLKSAYDQTPLSGIGQAIMHPIDTARNVADVVMHPETPNIDNPIKTGIGQAINDTADNLKQGYQAHKAGNQADADLHYISAIPGLGSVLNKGTDQYAAGNYAGEAGTLLGFAAMNTLAPKALAYAAPKIIGGGLKVAGKAAQIAGASADSLKLAGSRVLAPGGVGETLIRATKPGVKYGPAGEVAQSYEQTLPKALAENPNINSVSGLGEAYDAAKQTNHGQYAAWRDPHVNLPVDTTPLVQQQVRSIPATNKFETPSIIGNTAKRASVYDMTPRVETSVSPIVDSSGNPIQTTRTITPQKPTLGTVDAIRQDTNAKLNSFYNKEGGDQAAALSNPETARLKAVNDGSRDLVYKNLADANGIPEEDIRSNQRMYGQLSDAGNAANKRGLVFDRQDPVSLAEKMSVGHGGPIASAFNYGKEKLIQSMTNSDGLVASAVDRYRNPAGTPLSQRLVPGANSVQQGLSKFGRAIMPPASGLPGVPTPLVIPPLLATRKRRS